jgi:exonuclease VII small subunit
LIACQLRSRWNEVNDSVTDNHEIETALSCVPQVLKILTGTRSVVCRRPPSVIRKFADSSRVVYRTRYVRTNRTHPNSGTKSRRNESWQHIISSRTHLNLNNNNRRKNVAGKYLVTVLHSTVTSCIVDCSLSLSFQYCIMETRNTSRKSSKLAGLQFRNKPSIGSQRNPRFGPLQLMGTMRAPMPTHNRGRRSFWSQSSVTRDNASVVGRIVGNNGSSEPPEMSQMTCSQGSIAEHHDTVTTRSGQSRFASLSFPPLHQNSSVSSCSSADRRGSVQQSSSAAFSVGNGSNPYNAVPFLGNRLLPHHRRQEQSLHSTMSTSTHDRTSNPVANGASSSSTHSSSNRSVGGPSQLLRRMNPRRIGTSSMSRNSKPTSRAPPTRLLAQPSSQATLPAGNASTIAGTTTTTSSLPNPSSAEANKLQSLHAELKSYFEKNIKSMEESTKEIERKQSQLDNSVRQCEEQQEQIDEKLDSFDTIFDSRQNKLNQVYDERVSTMEHKATLCIEIIDKAGETQLEVLSKSFQASMKKVREATQTINSLADSFTQTYDQTVQALPSLIQPTLMKMVDSLYPMVQNKTPLSSSTAAPPSPITDASSKKVSSEEDYDADEVEVQQELSNNTTKSQSHRRSYFTRKHKHSTTPINTKSLKDRAAPSSSKRRTQRRSKRAKDYSEKENKTPLSKMARPCVTPSGETSKREPFSPADLKNTTKRKPVSSMTPKAMTKTTSKTKKRAFNNVVETFGSTKKKRVPLEVVADNGECPSPLGEDSMNGLAEGKATNISNPRGSSYRRVKRKQTYGRKRPLRSDSMQNEFLADSFAFCF